jgi:hypothetical protein
MGEPSFESVILPVIVFDWAKTCEREKINRKPSERAFVMKILVFFIRQIVFS